MKREKLVFGRRLHGEEVEYYNPYQIKKVGFLEGDNQKANRYKDGYFSDGAYLMKLNEKPKVKHGFSESPPNIERLLLSTAKGTRKPAEIVAELYNGKENDIVLAHVRSKDKKTEAFFNIKYIDSILTRYPMAKIYIKDNESPLVFKINKEAVACVMPIRDPKFSEYVMERMKKNG